MHLFVLLPQTDELASGLLLRRFARCVRLLLIVIFVVHGWMAGEVQ